MACGGSNNDAATAPNPAPASTSQATAPAQEAAAETPSEAASEDQDEAGPAPSATPADTAAADGGDDAAQAGAPVEPDAYDNANALALLRTLAVEIGPRVQGTEGEQRAATFLSDQFQELGYNVERESFSIPAFNVEQLEVLVDGAALTANAFVLASPGSVQGGLVAVPGTGSPGDFAQVDVRNAVALVERGTLLFADKVTNAAAAGAVGVMIFNNAAGAFEGGFLQPSAIPAVAISREDGLRLRDLTAVATVTASILLEGRAAVAQSQNVITIPQEGSCAIYVGGHYDTVEGVPGANDNASGTALVLELARAFAASPTRDLVCFAAFGAEEAVGASAGIAGSRALVERITNDPSREPPLFMLNLDVAGAGPTLLLVETQDLVGVGQRVAAGLSIPVRAGGLPPNTGSDHLNFEQAGASIIFPTRTGSVIHAPTDTFEAIQPDLLDETGRLAHALLRCLIVLAGGDLTPPAGCLEPTGGT